MKTNLKKKMLIHVLLKYLSLYDCVIVLTEFFMLYIDYLYVSDCQDHRKWFWALYAILWCSLLQELNHHHLANIYNFEIQMYLKL